MTKDLLRAIHWTFPLGVLWALMLLPGCPSNTGQTKTPKKEGTFGWQASASCKRFVDARTGLSFCVPRGATLTKSKKFSGLSHDSFEAKIALPKRKAEIWVRRDQLPEELPEGALAGAWLLRYTEGYAQHRGAQQAHLQRKLLPKEWARFVKADTAAWAAFPLTGSGPHQWEEVIVLARNKPATRVVISMRLSDDARQQRKSLFKLLLLFVKHLRLSR